MIDTDRRPERIHLDRISLTASTQLGRLSSRPIDFDYFADALQENASQDKPPPNVKRQLFFPSCIENLKKAGQELGTLGVTGLKLFIAKQYLPKRPGFTYAEWPEDLPSSAHLPEHLPTETGVSYTYTSNTGEQTQIAGSPVISALHGLSLREYMSDEMRTKIIKYHFNNYLEYLPDHDVTVIAIPPRKKDTLSPTHEVFASLAVPHPETGEIVEHTNFDGRHVDLYFFPHGEGNVRAANIQKAQNLITDIRYRRVLQSIDGAWAQNFSSDEVQREQDEHMALPGVDRVLARRQVERMNNILEVNTPGLDPHPDHSITLYEYPGTEPYPVGYVYK